MTTNEGDSMQWKTKDIRFAGTGGQGIVIASVILARAASLYEGLGSMQRDMSRDARHEGACAVQTQTYGPEARGGASKAEVKISDEEILYPYVDVPDILVVMSEKAWEKYGEDLKDSSIVILDATLVKSRPARHVFYEIPATQTATDVLGKRVVANIVMLGALCAITGVVSKDALKKALLDSIPKGTEEINIAAFEKGCELGTAAPSAASGRGDDRV